MSSSKYASLTSAMLSRKGEAKPSLPPNAPSQAEHLAAFESEIPHVPVHAPSVAEVASRHQSAVPESSIAPEDKRRMVITLHKDDFERLCIVAVKQGMSRPHLVHDLLLSYLEQAAGEFETCCCLATAKPCDCA